MFNMIEQLFAPGRKHTTEEQKRLELSRVDVDANDPGRGPIDLASGKVTIRVPGEQAGETKQAEQTESSQPSDASGPSAEPPGPSASSEK
ncbi:DUF6191 domain-containing protein [Streptomyces sp. SID3212]|uniref:DUF6191 domain-containing protein n=1 Tax=Streptomyces sp. SID3212 TaxID=2690259 RepID=UPI00136A6982|nr:hypothetical protein [Streptomyces sp. SID3212]